jgi:acetyl-CoA acetyltransferase
MTNPAYFAMWARRRIDLYGATVEDFAQVKVKNAANGLHNPYARYRKEVTAADVDASPTVSSPLRLLDICATSDGGAAIVLTSMDYARKHLAAGKGSGDPLVRVAAVSTVTPTFPNTILEMPNFATDSAAGIPVPERGFKQAIGDAAYAQAGLGPDDVQVAEVYDLSTALELDWYEDLGFCEPGGAEKLLRDGVTAIDGRLPVNPSGGLACFGEAVPAQAIAQVCELTWQLRGTAQGAQANDPTVGITANQGLFGHGSSVILTR